jgi:Zn-dependent M28 family amino/carboxypeptidase
MSSATSKPQIENRIREHVITLAGMIGERNVFRPQALAAARDYIEAIFKEQGYRVNRQEYEARDVVCANLEATLPGASRPEQILLLGAHYDSVAGSPGANDDGSGVASLLEIARLSAGTSAALSVRFLAFVNEEPPFFLTSRQGSAVYARAARRRGDDIRLMVSLETMGCYLDVPGSQRSPPLLRRFYPDRGNFLALISDFRSLPAARHMARLFRAHSDFPLEYAGLFRWFPGVAWSDHLSFWRQGYRAVMATDTAYQRYRYYHTSEDTPDKVNIPKLAEATVALCRCCTAMAEEGLDALG